MLSSLWEQTKLTWTRFNLWMASLMPGLKTKLVTGLGAIGSAAAMLQGYITGLPLDKLLSATQLLVLAFVLFTLAFWFRGLTDLGNDGSN